MTTVSIQDLENRFTELISLVEGGETIVITRDGKPVLDIVPHQPKGGLNLEGLREFKRKHGIDRIFGPIPEDFDDPLPEDFLLRPLPE